MTERTEAELERYRELDGLIVEDGRVKAKMIRSPTF